MFSNFRLGIVGAGRWGVNHVRTASELLAHDHIIVCDGDASAETKVKAISPDLKFTTNFNELLQSEDLSAVIIATPAHTHYSVAKQALLAGKHCLVEKPITLVSAEAEELVKIAEENKLVLMVGHVLLYHEAIRAIKAGLTSGKVGDLQYIYSNRLNLGAVRTEENSLWSFAPHDISIMQYLTESNPTRVSSHGAAFIQPGIEDSTITVLEYPGNIHAHSFVSWLHPFKEHRLVVIGSKGMFVFEDTVKENKLKFYSKGFKNVDGRIEPFEGSTEFVEIKKQAPLAEEQKHFFHCVLKGEQPLTDGKHAVEVLRILEAAQKELYNG